MTTTLSRGKTKWDEAIADARRKIRALQFSINVFKKKKKAGDVWPGEKLEESTQ